MVTNTWEKRREDGKGTRKKKREGRGKGEGRGKMGSRGREHDEKGTDAGVQIGTVRKRREDEYGGVEMN